MTIEQTVEITPSRRVYFDVPARIPLGKTRITVEIDEPAGQGGRTSEENSVSGLLALRGSGKGEKKPVSSLRALMGSCEGEDTLEAYFERKRADKLIEIEHEKHISGWEG
jgi:hypothetical protein